jgi:hypothetical protein
MNIRARLIASLILLMTFLPSFAQKQSLTSILNNVSKTYNVNFSFSPKLTDAVYPANAGVSGKSLEQDIRNVLQGTNFTFKKINDKYYQIVPLKAQPAAPERKAEPAKPVQKPVEPAPAPKEPEPMPEPEPAKPVCNVKTNLIADVTLSPSLGFEWATSEKNSVNLGLAFNPWTFSSKPSYMFLAFSPEYRFWKDDIYEGAFVSADLYLVHFNLKNITSNNYGYKGMGYSIGASYGYRWNLNSKLAFEAQAGAGLCYLSYDKSMGNGSSTTTACHKFIPALTKLRISLVYNIR